MPIWNTGIRPGKAPVSDFRKKNAGLDRMASWLSS